MLPGLESYDGGISPLPTETSYRRPVPGGLPKDCAKQVEVIGSFPGLIPGPSPLPSRSSDLLSSPECKDVTSDSVCPPEVSGPDLHSPTAGHTSPEADGVYDLIGERLKSLHCLFNITKPSKHAPLFAPIPASEEPG